MTIVAAASVIAGALLLIAVGAWFACRPRLVRSRLRSRVIVTLKSGAVFDGTLYAADSQVWVLRGARAVSSETPVPADGEVVLLLADVDFAQRP